MSSRKKVLLLVGSPKNLKSSSNSIGGYLLKKLGDENYQKTTVCVYECLQNKDRLNSLSERVNDSDIIILSFPLYFDTLPAGLIRAMEFIKAVRKSENSRLTRQKLFIIANSGYPEKEQNSVALKSCEMFARKCGFEVAGSIAIGAGTLINGKQLENAGLLTSKLRKSLDRIADMIAKGEITQGQLDGLNTKLSVPDWGYVLMAHCLFTIMLIKNKVLSRMKDRPYLYSKTLNL